MIKINFWVDAQRQCQDDELPAVQWLSISIHCGNAALHHSHDEQWRGWSSELRCCFITFKILAKSGFYGVTIWVILLKTFVVTSEHHIHSKAVWTDNTA